MEHNINNRKFKNLKEAFGVTESDLRSMVLKRIVQKLKERYPVEFLNEYPMSQHLISKIYSEIPFEEKVVSAFKFYGKIDAADFKAKLIAPMLPTCQKVTYIDDETNREELKEMVKRKFKEADISDIDTLPNGHAYFYKIKKSEQIVMDNFEKNFKNVEILCKLIYGTKFELKSSIDGVLNYGIVKIVTKKRSNRFYIKGGINLLRKEIVIQLRRVKGYSAVIG